MQPFIKVDDRRIHWPASELCAVAEFKSFTTAAECLGLTPAMAGKHVMQLEQGLTTRVLNRATRHGATEKGAPHFQQTRQ